MVPWPLLKMEYNFVSKANSSISIREASANDQGYLTISIGQFEHYQNLIGQLTLIYGGEENRRFPNIALTCNIQVYAAP
jgi:hypothetical protein